MEPFPLQGLNILFSEKVVIRQSSSQCPGLSVCAVIGLKVNPKGNYPPLLCGTVSYVVRGQHCSSKVLSQSVDNSVDSIFYYYYFFYQWYFLLTGLMALYLKQCIKRQDRLLQLNKFQLIQICKKSSKK